MLSRYSFVARSSIIFFFLRTSGLHSSVTVDSNISNISLYLTTLGWFFVLHMFNSLESLKKPKIAEFDRCEIIILHQQGHSQKEIIRKKGSSRCGIQAVIKKYEQSGETKDHNRIGRLPELPESDDFLRVSSLIWQLHQDAKFNLLCQKKHSQEGSLWKLLFQKGNRVN